MLVFKVFAHPLNKVVLEHTLDELVKKVWSDELIDVGIGKVFREWLGSDEFGSEITDWEEGVTVTLLTIPYISHNVFESNAALHTFACLAECNRESGLSKLSEIGRAHV